MNTTCPTTNDEALQKVLMGWRIDATLSPRFHEQVWHRITLTESTKRKARL